MAIYKGEEIILEVRFFDDEGDLTDPGPGVRVEVISPSNDTTKKTPTKTKTGVYRLKVTPDETGTHEWITSLSDDRYIEPGPPFEVFSNSI